MTMTGNTRRTLASFIAAAMIALTAGTAALAQSESETHLAAARDAIRALGATNQFDAILPQAAAALRSELVRKDPNLQADINRIVDEKTLELASRRSDLEAEAARVYARVFTEDELTAIATFYQSDAGKKLIAEGPIATRELLRAAGVWQTGIARDLAQSVGMALSEVAAQAGTEAPAAENTAN